ncbi:MAG: divalent-cation tolerance protein CutA [Candidatus Omnitrophica bacterium]|nr:divalent-cation tolerance protein CutA [Candidatus Omnitrophota bacterium]
MAKGYNYIVIFVTTPSISLARKISKTLISKRLVACSNIVKGVNSIFFWKGRVEDSKECLLIMKSQERLFKKIEKEVRRLHNYEVPEVIAIPIVDGSKPYLDWVKETLV